MYPITRENDPYFGWKTIQHGETQCEWFDESGRKRGSCCMSGASGLVAPIAPILHINTQPVEPQPISQASYDLCDVHITKIISDNPPALGDYLSGKTGALHYLMGIIMKNNKGLHPVALKAQLIKRLADVPA